MVSSSSRVVVVVPTYNEAENLPLIVPEILAQDPAIEVLIVDDNSPDGTGAIADRLAADPRVHTLHRAKKEGLGHAYRDGFQKALSLDPDLVIQMDADFSHPPDQLPAFLEAMEGHDVVLGSRYLDGITVVNWPIERILISYFGNLYVRTITGLPIHDTTGGFRCVRSEWLEKIRYRDVQSDGYSFQIEMNYRFFKSGARMKEIPFLFLDRTRGTSKLTLWIAFEALWVAWWLRLASLFGRI